VKVSTGEWGSLSRVGKGKGVKRRVREERGAKDLSKKMKIKVDKRGGI